MLITTSIPSSTVGSTLLLIVNNVEENSEEIQLVVSSEFEEKTIYILKQHLKNALNRLEAKDQA